MIRFLFLFLVVTAFAETPAQFDALKARVIALQTQVNALQQSNALLLATFVTVDPNPQNNVPGPNITFQGANIHIDPGRYRRFAKMDGHATVLSVKFLRINLGLGDAIAITGNPRNRSIRAKI